MTAPLLRSPQAGDAPAIAGLLDELGFYERIGFERCGVRLTKTLA